MPESQATTNSSHLTAPNVVIRQRILIFLSFLLVIATLVWASYGTDLSVEKFIKGFNKSI